MHGVTLTHELRQQLRAAIDQAVRRQLTVTWDACSGCGAHRSNRTIGCRACSDRHRAKERRQDAAYRREQNYLRTLRRHKRRLEQQGREVPA